VNLRAYNQQEYIIFLTLILILSITACLESWERNALG
jgi:hypothetical protein